MPKLIKPKIIKKLQKNDCGHTVAELEEAKQVCNHLFNKKASEYYRSFTGQGKQYHLICNSCKAYLNKFVLELKTVCVECFKQIEDQYFFQYLGKPGVIEAPSHACVTHHKPTIPFLDFSTVQAITPIALDPISGERGSKWLLLDTANHLKLLDLNYNYVSLLAIIPYECLKENGKIKMHVAPGGDFVAVISTGRTTVDHKAWNHGVVVRLNDGQITMPLDRGDYHTEQSDFSCVFFESDNKTLLVHATNWNQLDISDPATGELLTARNMQSRPSESWRFNKENTTEFSGRLVVSPNQQWIVDSGWIWHPAGVVSRWDLQHWISKNIWEADNGPSKLSLVERAYFWDGPLCWIDDNTLCVWGLGNDDENMIAAALIIDVQSGVLKEWFPGPGAGLFVFDEYLYTVDTEAALSVWDVITGHRIHYEADFSPLAYDAVSKTFLSIVNGECVLSTLEFNQFLLADIIPQGNTKPDTNDFVQ